MKQRLITGIIAGIVFLGFCFLGGLPYHILVLAMALIGYYEFVRMTQVPSFGGIAMLGYLGILMFMFPWSLLDIPFPLQWNMRFGYFYFCLCS